MLAHAIGPKVEQSRTSDLEIALGLHRLGDGEDEALVGRTIEAVALRDDGLGGASAFMAIFWIRGGRTVVEAAPQGQSSRPPFEHHARSPFHPT